MEIILGVILIAGCCLAPLLLLRMGGDERESRKDRQREEKSQ